MRAAPDWAGRISGNGVGMVGAFMAGLLAGVVAFLALACAVLLVLLAATAAHAGTVAAGPPPAAAPYRATLLRAAHTSWGLNAPVAALAAQVHAESAWQPAAVSRVGAQGLAQFMPATAAWWCQAHPETDRTAAAACQPENPTWALRAMAGYDRWLCDRLAAAGPEPDRLWATLRSYNGGLGHWQTEATHAQPAGPGLNRAAIDAACGSARRAVQFCPENLGYPRRILLGLQPRYSAWGRVVEVTP